MYTNNHFESIPLKVNSKPGRKNLRIICSRLLTKHPHLREELLGRIVGSGYDALLMSLEYRIDNLRRGSHGTVQKKRKSNGMYIRLWFIEITPRLDVFQMHVIFQPNSPETCMAARRGNGCRQYQRKRLSSHWRSCAISWQEKLVSQVIAKQNSFAPIIYKGWILFRMGSLSL